MEKLTDSVIFRGRRYYYKSHFPETVKGRKGAKEYAKKLAVYTKSYTLVRKVVGVGYCVYGTD